MLSHPVISMLIFAFVVFLYLHVIAEWKRNDRARKKAEPPHDLTDIDRCADELLKLLAYAHAQLDKRVKEAA